MPIPETLETRAESGSADAQFHLGLRWANGKGLAQNYEQAAKWYLKAAEQDHVLAQFNLGIMFANGQGVARNDTEADAWFGRCARQGDAGAQHRLGISHYRASLRGPVADMPESRIEAYKWFVLAAAQGYFGSDIERDTVVLRMTHEDVAEAARRAGSFTPSIRGNATHQ